jgi:ribulose bisphosphate carboxylase small subunit
MRRPIFVAIGRDSGSGKSTLIGYDRRRQTQAVSFVVHRP